MKKSTGSWSKLKSGIFYIKISVFLMFLVTVSPANAHLISQHFYIEIDPEDFEMDKEDYEDKTTEK